MTNFLSKTGSKKADFLKPKVIKRRAWKTLNIVSTLAIVFNTGMVGILVAPKTVSAATTLGVQILSWNILGVDSNKPVSAGPHSFLIQARVTNSGASVATGVESNFTWGTGTSYLSLVSASSFPLNSINPGESKDVFYVVKVTPPTTPDSPSNDVFDKTKQFTISVTTPDAPTNSAGQTLIIENLVSQNRNSVYSATISPTSPLVGQPFTVTVVTHTTGGGNFDDVSPLMTYNPSVATLDSVTTHYEIPGTTESDIYSNDVGGTMTSVFHFRANVAGNLNFYYLIYDHSGGSYHYNSDFGGAIIVPVDPRQNLEKTVDKATAAPGDALTYTLKYFNTGNIDLANVFITETYDSNFVFGSSTPAPNSSNNVWDIGTLLVGTGGTITIHGTLAASFPDGTTKVHNVATMTTTTPDVPSLQATADTNVLAACNLTIVKSVDKSTAKPGDTLTYTLTYQNIGNAYCTGGGVRVDDTIPAGTTYTGWHTGEFDSAEPTSEAYYGYPENLFGTANPDGFNPTTKLLSWNAGYVQPNEKGTLKFSVTVDPLAACQELDIDNKGIVYADQIPGGVWSNEVTTHVAADCYGKLKVKKIVDAGTMTPDSWSFTVGSTTLKPAAGTDYVVFDLPAGTYSATENTIPGYHQVSSTCGDQIVAPNQTTTCEFHNTQDVGKLTVIKHVAGSTEPASSWTMNVAGNTPLSFAGSETGTTNTVVAGNYAVTETGPADFTLTYSGDCDKDGKVTITNGDNKTCTLTNTRDTGTIKVMKNVDTDGDGKIDVYGATDWTWDISGGQQNIATGSSATVDTGNYTINEDQKTNFHVVSLVCGTQNFGAVESASISVSKDENVVCTFTNARDTGRIDGYKFEDMNSNGAWDTGEPVIPGIEIKLSNGWTDTTDVNGYYSFELVPTGTYSLEETIGANWTNTTPNPVTNVIVTKDNTTSVNFGNFKLGRIWGYKYDTLGNTLPGWEICLTGKPCTTTNGTGMYEFTGLTVGTYVVTETLQAGWWAVTPLISGHIVNIISGSNEQRDFTNFKGIDVTVCKYVDMNGDGDIAGDPLYTGVNGWNVSVGGLTQSTDKGCTTFTNLGPGHYDVTEDTTVAGWVQTYPSAGSYSFDAVSGQNETFNFGNFQTPKLTVIKHVINDNGGTKVAGDFSMTVGGNNVSDVDFPGNELGTTVTLNAGSYVVDELPFTGYVKSLSPECTGMVYSGDEVTCTITNNDIAPSLTLNKILIKDNGGTAVESDWTLTADGGLAGTLSGPGATGNTDVVSNDKFKAGTYALSESTGPSGYGASSWSCVKNNNAPVDGASIMLALGDTATCTVTNDDITAHLKLVKTVIKDNGGTAEADDWTLKADGPTIIEDDGVAEGDVKAGTYALSEFGGPSGYTASSWVCNNGLLNGSNLTLALNQTATCTITNDDVAPQLTLVKQVKNDNGGNNFASEWTLSATGYKGFSELGVQDAVENEATVGPKPVEANIAYTLSESGPSGYNASSWNCVGGSLDKGTITLTEGQSATCTITNDDIAPKLTMVKQVINDNGGNNFASEWTLTANGTELGFSETGVQNVNPSINDATVGPKTVKANVAYTLSESGPVGYDKSDWVCVGGTFDKGTITLNEGDTATCTITNNDQAPSITLIKDVDNGNGGNAQPNDFKLTIGGAAALSGVKYDVDANKAYALNETQLTGYNFVSITGDNKCPDVLGGEVTLDEGEDITCTIKNDDIPGRVVGFKYEDVNHNGVQDPSENPLEGWTFYLRTDSQTGPIVYTTTSNASGLFEFTGINMGTYYLTENLKTKWDQITPSAGFYPVNVTPGYDNGRLEAPFIFGNAQRITLGITKFNYHEVGHGGTGIAQTTDTINYHIDWSVAGNSIAQNVVLTDIIPVELNLNVASISNGGAWNAATRTITWDFGTQQPNASGYVTYTATVIVPIANGTPITNTAKISADNADPKFAQDTSTVTVASAPVLQITKTVNATYVNPGDPVTYTVKVKNVGTDTAKKVILTDTLPAGFTFVDGGGITKTFALGDMAVGAEITTTYLVTVDHATTAGFYDNLAKAKADNAAEVSTHVTVEVRVPKVLGEETKPILQIKKTVSDSDVAPNDVITYTVEIKNTGDGTAINVQLDDLLPLGFTFDGSKDTSRYWKVGDLKPGESTKVAYKVKVGSSVPTGEYENLAIAKADNHGKVSASVPVNVKRGRVLGETVDTGAGWIDYTIAGLGLSLIVIGYVLIRRKMDKTLA
ncbi:MAG: SdrD B-like domain-containing protein [Patescibacteria group bacterium]